MNPTENKVEQVVMIALGHGKSVASQLSILTWIGAQVELSSVTC
jgi:hypothetical protein